MKSTKKIRVLSIFGTRPEAVKMAPLMRQLAADPALESIVCVTGQHKTMLRQVMDLFGIVAHYDLDIMLENQTLNGLSSRLFLAIDEVLSKAEPDRVVVQPGHSLWRIARRVYGSGVRYTVIYQANRDQIRDPGPRPRPLAVGLQRRLVEAYDRGRPDLEAAYLAQIRASDAGDRALCAARRS